MMRPFALLAVGKLQFYRAMAEGPETFLRKLGLEEISSDTEPSWVKEDFGAAGYDEERCQKIEDPFGEEAIDLMFCTQRTGRYFLSTNYARILDSMRGIESAAPRSAKVFAELGGGTGILTMWLAIQNPGSVYHVLDHSANTLAFGKKWAAEQGIANISFHKCSYAQVASGEVKELACDFVFADQAARLTLHLRRADLDFPLHWETLDAMYDDGAGFATSEFVKAGNALLKSAGEFYVANGGLTFESIYMVARAARECGLSINWQRTDSSDGLKLALHRSETSMFETPEEDARALCTGKLETVDCDRELSESFKCLFDRGRAKVIFRAEYDAPEGKGLMELLTSDGLALLFQGNEHFGARAIFASASTLPDLASRALERLTECYACQSGSFVIAPWSELLVYEPDLGTFFDSDK